MPIPESKHEAESAVQNLDCGKVGNSQRKLKGVMDR
jgi:hypothetical protein